jgi:hypothetical protein
VGAGWLGALPRVNYSVRADQLIGLIHLGNSGGTIETAEAHSSEPPEAHSSELAPSATQRPPRQLSLGVERLRVRNLKSAA